MTPQGRAAKAAWEQHRAYGHDDEAWDAAAQAAVAASAVRDVVCKLLDLFSAPDGRLMQHASVTRSTLQRYAKEAGVVLDRPGAPQAAHVAPELAAAMRESRELRELVSEILAALEAAWEYGEFPADAAVDQWRQRAGLDAAPGGTREGT